MSSIKENVIAKELVAVYARVSTEDQHSSIENQYNIFYKWVNDNGYEIYEIYTDEAVSGTKGSKRSEWQRLLQDGRNKKYNVLLSKSFSRFGRNQRETLDAIKDLRAMGIRVVFLEDNLDSLRDSNNFGLFAWLAEQEAQRTSDRLKLIWESYNKEGKMHVCLPPYGYDYDTETKNYNINYEEAKIVKQIFGWYIEGYGVNKIANMLIENNIKTKRGGRWAGNTISGIIKNESYIGVLVQGRSKAIDVTMHEREKIPEVKWYKHIDNHIPIIDESIFYRAQELLEERAKMSKGTYLKRRSSNATLFSNLLICGECGATMSVKRKKNSNYKNGYTCIAYSFKGKKVCGHSSNFIWEDILICIIRNHLELMVKNDFKEIMQVFKQSTLLARPKYADTELKMVNAQIDSNLKLSMTLMVNNEKGLIGETQYKMQNELIEQKLVMLKLRKEELEKLPKEEVESNEEIILTQGISNLILLDDERWTNSLLKSIVEKITVYIDGRVDIQLKYLNNKDGNFNPYRLS